MDVTREADVVALVARAQQAFGRLDIMICNAGFGYYGAVEEMDPEIMRRMMDVNFMGTFYGARAALPVFRRQGHGHLMFVSSIVGKRGIPLHERLQRDQGGAGRRSPSRCDPNVAGTDIHVSAVFPVSTTTEFRDAMERDFGHQVSGLGPKQSVDHVARAIVRVLPPAAAEVYPHRASRGLAILNAIAPAFTDRLMRKYGRRRVVAPAPSDPTRTRAR